MKRRCFILSTACSGLTLESAHASLNLTKLDFADNGKPLKNPGMGISVYYYANSLKYYATEIDKLSNKYLISLPGVTSVIFRIPWSFLQSEPNKFHWELIDTPLKRFSDIGLRAGIRVTTSENQESIPYATPKWVFDAGAQYVRFNPGHPGTQNEDTGKNYEPLYSDPVFLRLHDKFVGQLSERYARNPNIEFIDIGGFGVYGEGHTWSSTKRPYTHADLIPYIESYTKHFKGDQLFINHNYADHNQDGTRDLAILDFALSKGVGLRDDSIMIEKGARAFYNQKTAKKFAENAKVFIETGEYSTLQQKGHWNCDTLHSAVRQYRASYLGAYWWPSRYFSENADCIARLNTFLGYRLRLVDVSLSVNSTERNILSLSSTQLHVELANFGVAKPGFPVSASLMFFKNGVQILRTTLEITTLGSLPGFPGSGDRRSSLIFQLPSSIPKGESFDLAISFAHRLTHMEIKLPHDEYAGLSGVYGLGVLFT